MESNYPTTRMEILSKLLHRQVVVQLPSNYPARGGQCAPLGDIGSEILAKLVEVGAMKREGFIDSPEAKRFEDKLVAEC